MTDDTTSEAWRTLGVDPAPHAGEPTPENAKLILEGRRRYRALSLPEREAWARRAAEVDVRLKRGEIRSFQELIEAYGPLVTARAKETADEVVMDCSTCRPTSHNGHAWRLGVSGSRSTAIVLAAAQVPNRYVTTLAEGQPPLDRRSIASPPRRRACARDQSYDDGSRPWSSRQARIAPSTFSRVQRGSIAPGWHALQYP